MPDLKGLKGDTSDNIPGVPGVGDKTAVKLIQQFGSVEGVLEHVEEVEPERLREALRSHREQALRSKELATIDADAPVTLDLEACRVDRYDRQRVLDLFRELEFRSLVSRLPAGRAGLPEVSRRRRRQRPRRRPRRRRRWTIAWCARKGSWRRWPSASRPSAPSPSTPRPRTWTPCAPDWWAWPSPWGRARRSTSLWAIAWRPTSSRWTSSSAAWGRCSRTRASRRRPTTPSTTWWCWPAKACGRTTSPSTPCSPPICWARAVAAAIAPVRAPWASSGWPPSAWASR